jgi:triacylglycerol lipase
LSFLVELPQNEFNPHAFTQFAPKASFNVGNALAMAWISQLAYETRLPEKICAIGKLWDLSNIRVLRQPVKSTLPLSDTRGVIATKENALIVSFSGTDPLSLFNWASDFYVGQPTADVHEGFLDAAAAVWAEVGAAIEAGMKEKRPLFVVGHSLGAAIAMATVDRARAEKGLDTAQVFVFGAPRVGRRDFATRYNGVFGPTTYRFVHGKDIVPTVPPSDLGFRHVGRYLSCTSGAKFDLTQLLPGFDSDEPSSGSGLFSAVSRLPNFFGASSLTSRFDTLGKLTELLAPSIGDHLPDRYYTALTL